MSAHPGEADRAPETLDVATIIRAGSNGFTLLLVVELATSAAARLGHPGGLLLSIGAAAVYVTTGRRAATGGSLRAFHGAGAAALAYGLTIPLRIIAGAGDRPWPLLVGLTFAGIVGALGGRSTARATRRADGHRTSRRRGPASRSGE